MKIEGFPSEILKLINQEIEKRETGKGSGNVSRKSFESKGISVELSSHAKALKPEEVQRQKVEEIKRALREGNYSVNPHKISEAIIREIFGE